MPGGNQNGEIMCGIPQQGTVDDDFLPNFKIWSVISSLEKGLVKTICLSSPETETRCKNFSPTENLSITTSMIQAGDSLSHQFPILSELMNFRSHMDGIRFGSWTFREVLDRLLAISAAPVKQTLKVNIPKI